MSKLYDLEIDLSSSNGGFPAASFKDWMRVRAHGHGADRFLVFPVLTGTMYLKNEGDGEVQLRRGASIPIRIARGEWVTLMFDGSPNGMSRV